MSEQDEELAALTAVSTALAKVDDAARERVLTYAIARFAPGLGIAPAALVRGRMPIAPGSSTHSALASAPDAVLLQHNSEIAGIARLSDSGELKVTIRDLKAKSGLDAAVRLATVATYAYNTLAGQPFSSRHGLTPLLKQWRLYDGNTRKKIADDKGILRDGDNLTLDAHAKQDAERYIEEIRDASVDGSWRPSK